jgi:hypothetical protein
LDVLGQLRKCGVVVHHAARMPSAADGRESVVVFLEGAMGQFELARNCAMRIPGVFKVSFSGHTRTIMYVYGAEPRVLGDSLPRPGVQPGSPPSRPEPSRPEQRRIGQNPPEQRRIGQNEPGQSRMGIRQARGYRPYPT